MDSQLLTSVTAGAGFTIGGFCAYFHLRRKTQWATAALRMATFIAVIVNAVYFFRSVGNTGAIETFRQNFESTVLLATLIGLVGVGTHFSPTLRGLDGFLFLLAAAIQFEENAHAQMLAATAGEIQPLSELELDELSKSSPPEFMAHYASKIWKYYVQEGIAVGIIPESWKSELN